MTSAPPTIAADHSRYLGSGRSAQVFLEAADASDEKRMVRKVFVGEPVSRAVLYVLTGSANPYTWCEAAIEAAILRRAILVRLVGYWFGEGLRIPVTGGYAWNAECLAFEMRAEFIRGRHVPLVGMDENADDVLDDLLRKIMRPLQRHLRGSGFDGLVWQAGLGNPVAIANFMHVEGGDKTGEKKGEGTGEGTGEGGGWVWIDMESGVPALFAMNPLATLGFYLPKSMAHGGALFDDVDIERMGIYLEANRERLKTALGEEGWGALQRDVEALDDAQGRWKSLPRHVKGIEYALSQEKLSAEEAARYTRNPIAWYGRMFLQGCRKGMQLAGGGLHWLGRMLGYRRLRWAVLWMLAFLFTQRFRVSWSRRLVGRRLRSWRERKMLTADAARELRAELRSSEASVYIGDFGVHFWIKPFVKVTQWVVFPALVAAGWVDLVTAGLVIAAGGAVARTLYTLGRVVQCWLTGQRRPWVALGVGILPMAGNAAFPAELVYCSTGAGGAGRLARFIVLDTFAAVGRAVPIWGGADSLLEHRCNRLGVLFIGLLGRFGRWRGKGSGAVVTNESEMPVQESAEAEVVVRAVEPSMVREAEAVQSVKMSASKGLIPLAVVPVVEGQEVERDYDASELGS